MLYNSTQMKKRVVIGVISAVVLLFGVAGSSNNNQSPNLNTVSPNNATSTTKIAPVKDKPNCDGTAVTSKCALDGVNYETYIYHPAVAEKTHVETTTSYKKETTGYCTLCSDGTYSPSCATGRGACSHHGGVAQWNAPIYSNVPVYDTKTVVDAPAQDAYYEKVTD